MSQNQIVTYFPTDFVTQNGIKSTTHLKNLSKMLICARIYTFLSLSIIFQSYVMNNKMVRKPTFAGKAEEKDRNDIEYWAFEKTPWERMNEAWRLHCINYNIPTNTRLDKTANRAHKR